MQDSKINLDKYSYFGQSTKKSKAMNRQIISSLIIFCMLTLNLCFGFYQVTSLDNSSGFSSDKDKLEIAIDALNKAMLDVDEKQLQQLVMEEVTYGHSSGNIEDKTAFIKALVSGVTDFLTLETSDQEVLIKDDFAWVRHIMNADLAATNNGKVTIRLKVLQVWIKDDAGNWKLFARQAVRI